MSEHNNPSDAFAALRSPAVQAQIKAMADRISSSGSAIGEAMRRAMDRVLAEPAQPAPALDWSLPIETDEAEPRFAQVVDAKPDGVQVYIMDSAGNGARAWYYRTGVPVYDRDPGVRNVPTPPALDWDAPLETDEARPRKVIRPTWQPPGSIVWAREARLGSPTWHYAPDGTPIGDSPRLRNVTQPKPGVRDAERVCSVTPTAARPETFTFHSMTEAQKRNGSEGSTYDKLLREAFARHASIAGGRTRPASWPGYPTDPAVIERRKRVFDQVTKGATMTPTEGTAVPAADVSIAWDYDRGVVRYTSTATAEQPKTIRDFVAREARGDQPSDEVIAQAVNRLDEIADLLMGHRREADWTGKAAFDLRGLAGMLGSLTTGIVVRRFGQSGGQIAEALTPQANSFDTGDPGFDPNKQVTINGYLFWPDRVQIAAATTMGHQREELGKLHARVGTVSEQRDAAKNSSEGHAKRAANLAEQLAIANAMIETLRKKPLATD
jgi:hypothetical protein